MVVHAEIESSTGLYTCLCFCICFCVCFRELWVCCQFSLLVLSEFRRNNFRINLFHLKSSKTYCFLVISGGIKVYKLTHYQKPNLATALKLYPIFKGNQLCSGCPLTFIPSVQIISGNPSLSVLFHYKALLKFLGNSQENIHQGELYRN